MARGLRPGQMLSRDLIQPGTWLPILKSGAKLTPELIAKIRRFGLEGIALSCIDRERPREPLGLAPFLLGPEVEAIHAILTGRGGQEELRKVVYDAARRLETPRGSVEFRIPGPYRLHHPLNVFGLALAVGHAMGYGPSQLVSLGTGALLHDIGEALLPAHLATKVSALSAEEREMVRHHPTLGVALLTRAPRFASWLISRDAIAVVRHHHERWDGSGYPDGLVGSDIPRMASIVALADIYDALVSDRPFSRRTTTGAAYQTIRDMSGRLLDPAVVEAFVARVLPYPAGTEVVLSDERTARVVRASAGAPLRPVVSVDGRELDLDSERHLDIAGVQIPRRGDRVEVSLPARIRLGQAHGLWGKTANISAEGVCIDFVGAAGDLGPDVDVQFCASGAMDEPIKARVCWIRAGGDGTCRIGLFVRDGDLLARAGTAFRRVG